MLESASAVGSDEARRRLAQRVQMLESFRLTGPALGSALPLAALGTLIASLVGRPRAELVWVFALSFAGFAAAFRGLLGSLRRKNLTRALAALRAIEENGASQESPKTS